MQMHDCQTFRELGYKSCVPYFILFDPDLNQQHIRLYTIIEQMESNPDPKVIPTFSFRWFANLIGVEIRAAKKISQKLKDKGYITHYQKADGHWIWSIPKKEVKEKDEENKINTYPQGVPQQDTGGCPSRTPGGVPQQDTLNTRCYKVLKEKQKQGIVENPVSVFSDKPSVETHVENICATRNIFLEPETVNQGIYYAYETNKDKSYDSVNKRVNIFLKKVREGKWLIPQGYKGITSQYIRAKEEKEQIEKQKQYQEESQAAKHVFAAIATGEGFKAFQAAFRKLKDNINDKDINSQRMSAMAV